MIQVIKANGEKEPFDDEKLLRSIKRAGIKLELQSELLKHIKSKLYNNIPTAEIYHHITEYLTHSPHVYAKSLYGLKQAIMLLGPTGYPFEDFIAQILQAHGYTTKLRQILEGRCVSHEIDVIAQKNGKTAMIEAKFHNSLGIRSDVHVALYTKARFDDVKDKFNFDEAWLVTNTKVTTDAIQYASCSGMKIIGWSYPLHESLSDLIEQAKLHPITILSTLSGAQKATLLENHIVMCKDISRHPHLIDMLPLSQEEKKKVLEEVDFICKTETAI